MRDSPTLSGKRAFVTGASSGLGATLCRHLAAAGAHVGLSFLPSEQSGAEAVAEQCRAHSVETLLVPCDVTEDTECRAAADRLGWESLDILLNCAGRTKFVSDAGNLDALDAQDFEAIMAVNLIGVYQLTRALRLLLEKGAASGSPASIVNISSLAGVLGIGSSLAYAASKGALNTLTLGLAHALAPAIRVNAICAAYIDTGWFARGAGAEAERTVRNQVAKLSPFGTVLSPDDVAEVVLFLAGDGARHMSGELVPVSTLVGSIPNPAMLFRDPA